MVSKNENINKNENMTYEERIQQMKEKLGLKFQKTGKKIIKDAKVIKMEESLENFNTELNTLTFEVEEIYPLDYNTFKKEFPRIIEFINNINGAIVTDAVDKGLVIQGISVETNVNEIIDNIKTNVENKTKKEEQISLRKDVFKETQRMKTDYNIEWNTDLFWKCWKIKEGQIRWNYLIKEKGEELAKKRINDIKNAGGLEFVTALQEEIFGKK